MDAIPIRDVPTPTTESLKPVVGSPEIQSAHYEHAPSPSPPTTTAPTHAHLPRGVSETEAERKANWFIGSIDCGTTSSRFLIFDGEGNPVASHQIEFENMYPESG